MALFSCMAASLLGIPLLLLLPPFVRFVRIRLREMPGAPEWSQVSPRFSDSLSEPNSHQAYFTFLSPWPRGRGAPGNVIRRPLFEPKFKGPSDNHYQTTYTIHRYRSLTAVGFGEIATPTGKKFSTCVSFQISTICHDIFSELLSFWLL